MGKRSTKLTFIKFLNYILPQIVPGKPKPTDVQNDIAKFISDEKNSRIMVQAFRGVGKTYIAAIYVMYCLYHNPDIKISIISKSEEFAKKITWLCKSMLNLDALKHLKPTSDQRSSAMSFDVRQSVMAKDTSVVCSGIEGQITGNRANLVIADDIEISTNSDTPAKRENLEARTKEFVNLLNDAKSGRIIYLGTPHSEDSLYNGLPQKGYEIRIWPFQVPEDLKFYQGKLTPWAEKRFAQSPPGALLDPSRYTDHDLELRMSEGLSTYKLQNMLDTTLSDEEKHPLKLSDLIVMGDADNEVAPEKIIWSGDRSTIIDPARLPTVGIGEDRFHKPWRVQGDWLPYRYSVMAIDPSGRGKDETSYCVLKEHNGYFFLLDQGGFKGGYEKDVLEKLSVIAKKYGVKKIIIESNFGDGTWTELFKTSLYAIYPCTLEEERSSSRKELRIIDTLEPIMNQHRLIVREDVISKDYHGCHKNYPKGPNKYMLFYQMTRLTKDKGCLTHDDRLDVLALALSHMKAFMATNVDKQVESREEAFWRKLGESTQWDKPKGNDPRSNWNWKGVL